MKGDLQLGNFKVTGIGDPTNALDAVNLRSLTYDNFQNFTGTDVSANQLIVFTGTGKESVNASTAGDVTFTLSGNTYTSSISSGVIVNADVNNSAAIDQSKLAMNSATTRVNATGITQADRGLASFDSFYFTANSGWISLKNNSIEPLKFEQIAANRVLGNATADTNNVVQVPFSTVVDQGLGIKKAQFTTTGLLRRTNLSTSLDTAWSVVEMDTAATINRLVVRDDIDGGFSAGTVSFSRANITNRIDIGGNLLVDHDTNIVRIFGKDGNTGIRIENNSVTPSANITTYRNNVHQFRNAANDADAPITVSAITTRVLSTGGNTVSGQITGRWTLTGTSPTESRLQATYSADLAEYYEGDKDYPVGTVLVFGGEKEVTISNKQMDIKVAGVVSNTAAFVMFDACPGFKNLIALQGRVPVRVVGKIEKGDMLVTSNIPGVAVSATDVKVGSVIGKALESYNSNHIGTIEVAVGRT
jgi:hypothetical protein